MSKVLLRFPNSDTRAGGELAQSLREALRNEVPGIEVQQLRENSENQDFGATLTIVLAGPAIVAIAQGIKQWLIRQHGVTVEFTTPEGKVIAKNVTANNVVEILKAAKIRGK